MSHQGEGTIASDAGLSLPVLILFSFPQEVLRFVTWMWVTAVFVLLLALIAALVIRALILPFANPELYRLVTQRYSPLSQTSEAVRRPDG